MGSWFDQYFRSTFLRELVVRNSSVIYGDLDQVLFSVVDTFGDSFLHFLGFTKSVTYYTILVTYNYQRGKTESTAALSGFGNPVDSYNLFFQLQIASFYFIE